MPRIGRSFPVPPRTTRGPLSALNFVPRVSPGRGAQPRVAPPRHRSPTTYQVSASPIARLPVRRALPAPRTASPRTRTATTHMLPPSFPMLMAAVTSPPRQRHPVARQQIAVRAFAQPSAPGRRLLVGVGR
jgi:hypothetical protein